MATASARNLPTENYFADFLTQNPIKQYIPLQNTYTKETKKAVLRPL